ncbi:hypothetical protein IWZ03DRAFT_202256 [Phyllosticta citriasiana]|uniref:Uncharacterized protein n=1 Tax=Phyllosticta citriasiana TaxID=595635 RepID=A0ABR1KN96_9PEZI
MEPQQSRGKGKHVGDLRLLESGDYSNLEMHCQEDKWKIHKASVCPQSGFSRLAVRPETGFQEATSGVVRLHESNPDNGDLECLPICDQTTGRNTGSRWSLTRKQAQILVYDSYQSTQQDSAWWNTSPQETGAT